MHVALLIYSSTFNHIHLLFYDDSIFLQNTFAGHLIDTGILCGFFIKATPLKIGETIGGKIGGEIGEKIGGKIGGNLAKKSMRRTGEKNR